MAIEELEIQFWLLGAWQCSYCSPCLMYLARIDLVSQWVVVVMVERIIKSGRAMVIQVELSF